MHAVFEVASSHAAKIDEILKDDVVSRQSISVRDAKALGLGDTGRLVLIEGTDAAIARSVELFKDVGTRLAGEKADAALKAFRSQEEDAASGMGMIFG